jgi:group I intron endonuclease
MSIYSLYWIKHKNHIDPQTQGYIGISNNPERRFKEHKQKQDFPVHNAMKKYGDDVEMILLADNLTEQEAKDSEKTLRPKMHIGWNIMSGGGIPPSTKGAQKPDLSIRFSGSGNPFYGKKHTQETKKRLSESKTGDRNPFFGKERPDHSDKMKAKRGREYPKFKGYFLTPFGRYESFEDACVDGDIKTPTLYKYCIYSNQTVVTNLAYSKSDLLQRLGNRDEVVSKTYNEIGFGYEPK